MDGNMLIRDIKTTVAAETTATTAIERRPHWRIEDIDFSAANRQILSQDPAMLWLIVASSFVESASDLYTRNLLDYFADDPEISEWLIAYWEPEELQHGKALRAYVEYVWPEFDWDTAFRGFLGDYEKLCRIEVLGPTPALELVSRCVVETGTSTLYRAIRDATHDPVLREITDQIQRDEVRHFKHFFQYFGRNDKPSRPGRWAVLKTIVSRAIEIRNSDSDCALRHIIDGCDRVRAADKQGLHDVSRMYVLVKARVSQHYPVHAAAEMALTPLALPRYVKAFASRAISTFARAFAG